MMILSYYLSYIINRVRFVKLRLFTKNRIKTPNRYGSKTRFFVTVLSSLSQLRSWVKDNIMTMRIEMLDDTEEVYWSFREIRVFRNDLAYSKIRVVTITTLKRPLDMCICALNFCWLVEEEQALESKISRELRKSTLKHLSD